MTGIYLLKIILLSRESPCCLIYCKQQWNPPFFSKVREPFPPTPGNDTSEMVLNNNNRVLAVPTWLQAPSQLLQKINSVLGQNQDSNLIQRGKRKKNLSEQGFFYCVLFWVFCQYYENNCIPESLSIELNSNIFITSKTTQYISCYFD